MQTKQMGFRPAKKKKKKFLRKHSQIRRNLSSIQNLVSLVCCQPGGISGDFCRGFLWSLGLQHLWTGAPGDLRGCFLPKEMAMCVCLFVFLQTGTNARTWGDLAGQEGVKHCPQGCSEAPKASTGQCIYSSQVLLLGHGVRARCFSMGSAGAFGGNNSISLSFRSICS